MTAGEAAPMLRSAAHRHVQELIRVLRDDESLSADAQRWGMALTERFRRGSTLLVAGNGGSAAEAQHLTAELVGRFRSERRALPAIALHGDTSSVTAIGNDYGFDEVYARAVEAFARPRDVVLLLSTSGRSGNLVAAHAAARRAGASVWAMTGPTPNPLAACADEVIAVESSDTAVVQEVHLVVIHLLAATVDIAWQDGSARAQSVPA